MKPPYVPARAPHGFVSMLIGLLASASATAQPTLPANPDPAPYQVGTAVSDERFGAQVGAGSRWQPTLSRPSQAPAVVGFGGGVRLGCSGVDFNGFVRAFDPGEVIAQMRSALLNGAQAAASNYLITLAYASPTVASVLDMMDKKYTARFSAFAQTCDAQAARARSTDRGASRLAEAGDQCFDQETARGTPPSEAFRRCSIQHRFDGLDVPAAAGTADFFRRYTHAKLPAEIEALLSLLPDERVQDGAFQMQAPTTTVAQMSDRLRSHARRALEQLDAGTAPADIPACGAEALLGNMDAAKGCLPADALPLVTSRAFRSSRLLGDAARNLFNDALSTQIAIGSMYSNLLELLQQTARIDVRDSRAGDAAHALERRRHLREAIGELIAETDAQVKVQTSRGQLVRMQMMALEAVETDLNARSRRHEQQQGVPQFGMRGLLGVLSGGN